MTRISFLLAALVLAFPLFSQKEGNIWYFNRGLGLDFNQSPPALLRDGAIDTYEGCSAVCDSAGGLMLYTDGITLWNRRHQIVKGGMQLGGHSSSTQSGLIARQPGQASRYFVFTADAREHNLRNGIQYAVVDMNARNGAGKVLRSPRQLIQPACEKLTGVAHLNGRDIWIIAHGWNSNAFYAYLLTPEGLAKKPIVSMTGSTHGWPLKNAIGAMKVSSDGNWLACAIMENKMVELFRFDAASGQVASAVALPLERGLPYGIEFSPDNNWLYISTLYTGEIIRFSLREDSKSDLLASREILYTREDEQIGALQLGPDGKIYFQFVYGDWLGSIDHPNRPASDIGLNPRAYLLGKQEGRFGLPNFIQTYVRPGFVEEQPLVPQPKRFLQIQVKRKLFTQPENPNSAMTGFLPLSSAIVALADSIWATDSLGRALLLWAPDTPFMLSVAGEGYFRVSRNVELDTLPTSVVGPDTIFTLEVALDKIYPNKEITLEHIWYNFDDASIRPEASPAVDQLATVLLENPGLRVQLSAHTDCRGNAAYNLELSQRRAQSVVQYLAEKGIVPGPWWRSGMEKRNCSRLVPANNARKSSTRLTGARPSKF